MTGRKIKGSGIFLSWLVISFFSCSLYAQQKPSVPFNPKNYVAQQPVDAITIDGKLSEQSWRLAGETDFFIDIEGSSKPNPAFKTTVKMLWDDEYLYVAAYLEEPHIWGRLTQRDTVIFYDNDFEVFIDPDGDTHNYYELEINALGTLWDLLLTKPYRDDGQAIDGWDINGIKSAVDIQGTINNSADTDTGWTVELALPWSILEEAANHSGAPNDGEQWRINFSRVQWHTEIENGQYIKKRDTESEEILPEQNWVWSPQGVINMHYPEMWGFIQFSTKPVDKVPVVFKTNHEEEIKWFLRQLYYRQHQWKKEHGGFTSTPIEIEANKSVDIHSTQHTFEIRMENEESGKSWFINQTGRVWSQTLN